MQVIKDFFIVGPALLVGILLISLIFKSVSDVLFYERRMNLFGTCFEFAFIFLLLLSL